MKRDPRRRPPSKRAPSPARHWVRHAVAIAGLWVFALVTYSNSFHGDLSADADALVHDPRIAAATGTAVQALFHQQYWNTGVSGLYRPLTSLSYMFNYSVLGDGVSPAGYHWLNFLLHMINTGLVYLLGLVIFQRLGAAFLFAGLWSVHPVMTESVTNIAGRPDLLAGLGVLGGLLAHIRARDARGWCRIPWLALLVFCFAVALFSKENAIVLVGVMVAYDIAWMPPDWRNVLPGYAAAFVPAAAFLYVRARVLAGAPPLFALFTDNPLIGAGWWSARLTALHVIGKYIGLLIWPGALSSDYSYNSIPLFGWTMRTSSDWATAAAIAALVAGLVTVLCCLRNRAAWFFLALFAIALAPTANLVFRIGTIMAERFLYLPAMGFAGCVALAAGRWAPSRPRACAAVAVALCCLLAARTYARNNDWSTEANLWKSAVEAVPGNAKARIVTAQVALDSKHRDMLRAAADADRAIAILEPLPDTRISLSTTRRRQECIG
ncbi:MAG TPA: hypothetical protein VKB88_43125 [Bryobacteraceae bacterium]|nr:hypothetical protein [Bryobacteraceae bacterium]